MHFTAAWPAGAIRICSGTGQTATGHTVRHCLTDLELALAASCGEQDFRSSSGWRTPRVRQPSRTWLAVRPLLTDRITHATDAKQATAGSASKMHGWGRWLSHCIKGRKMKLKARSPGPSAADCTTAASTRPRTDSHRMPLKYRQATLQTTGPSATASKSLNKRLKRAACRQSNFSLAASKL